MFEPAAGQAAAGALQARLRCLGVCAQQENEDSAPIEPCAHNLLVGGIERDWNSAQSPTGMAKLDPVRPADQGRSDTANAVVSRCAQPAHCNDEKVLMERLGPGTAISMHYLAAQQRTCYATITLCADWRREQVSNKQAIKGRRRHSCRRAAHPNRPRKPTSTEGQQSLVYTYRGIAPCNI